LRPNETGPDVTQVQAALRASGSVLPKAEDGRFGAATQQAVLALYDRAGYEARYTQPSKAAVDALVNEAVTELEVARSDLAQATSSNDPSAIRSAKGAVSSAESTLAQRKATEGVVLPASEVLVVSELPGVLIDRPVEQGSRVEAGTPVVAVGSTNLVVRMDLTTAQAGELDGAGEAHVDDPGGDYEGTCSAGPVDSGAPAPGVAPEGESTDATGDNPVSGASEDDRGPSLVLSCTPAPGLDMVGANLRVTVTVPRSDGPVLAVPASAVATDSAGTTSVEVVDGEEVNRIEVSVGREAVGTVEVVPEVEGTLHEGMRVRVRHR
jgi:biotin carboxyl carrier protein